MWLGGLVRLGASLHGDPLLQCRVLGCAAPDAGVAGAEAAILADHSGRQTGVPEGVLRQISAPLASIRSCWPHQTQQTADPTSRSRLYAGFRHLGSIQTHRTCGCTGRKRDSGTSSIRRVI